jgi:hypothetical protein
MTASRISSGQSKGHKTSAPKIVLNTGRFDYDCSVDATNMLMMLLTCLAFDYASDYDEFIFECKDEIFHLTLKVSD